MAPDFHPPKFFSREFHGSFFPGVLKERLHFGKKASRRDNFYLHDRDVRIARGLRGPCLIGIPSAAEGALWGWILSILGIGGTIVLVVMSVRGQRGERPSYDDFLIGVFLFFVALGILIGIPVGMEAHSFWLGFLASLAGLAAGYVVGILGGMWLQYLGWIAVVINMAAGFGAIILSGTVLIMLAALAF